VYGDAPDRGEQRDPEVEVVHVAAGDHDASRPAGAGVANHGERQAS